MIGTNFLDIKFEYEVSFSLAIAVSVAEERVDHFRGFSLLLF
jgi:hypothetical protein